MDSPRAPASAVAEVSDANARIPRAAPHQVHVFIAAAVAAAVILMLVLALQIAA